MYNKTIIRFGFCDIQNNQGLGKGYQPQPSASADNRYLDLQLFADIWRQDCAIWSKNRKIVPYYMASSVSGQDESNPALWLPTRAGNRGTTRRVPQEKFPRKPYDKSFIDQAFPVKMTGY